MIQPPDPRRRSCGVSVSLLSITQIFALSCVRLTSFCTSKRPRGRQSVESEPLLNPTSRSRVRCASSAARSSTPYELVKSNPKKMRLERAAPPASPNPNGSGSGAVVDNELHRRRPRAHSPMPSTTPPDKLTSRHGVLAAWLATTSSTRRSTLPPRRRTADASATLPPAPARHLPMPSCPRAGYARAWGHPHAQAKGRARGPLYAVPHVGQLLLPQGLLGAGMLGLGVVAPVTRRATTTSRRRSRAG